MTPFEGNLSNLENGYRAYLDNKEVTAKKIRIEKGEKKTLLICKDFGGCKTRIIEGLAEGARIVEEDGKRSGAVLNPAEGEIELGYGATGKGTFH